MVILANDAPIRDANPRAPLAAVAIAAIAESWIDAPPPAGFGGGAIKDVTAGLEAEDGDVAGRELGELGDDPFWLV